MLNLAVPAIQKSLLFALILFLFCCQGKFFGSHQAILNTEKGSFKINLEIADTDEERTRGLMFRKELGSNDGMLFVWPSKTYTSFWMKNTFIPLDILFIDNNKVIVHIAENTTPFSEKPIPSLKPFWYVLEVNAGFVAKSGAKVGDKVELKL